MERNRPRKMNNLLRKIKIKNRLIISFLLLSILPVFIIGVYAYQQSSIAIRSKISTYSTELIRQLQKNIRTENQKFESFNYQVTMDKKVQLSLSNFNNLDSMARWQITLDVNEMLAEKFEILNHIKFFRIVTPEGEMFYDLGYDSFNEAEIDKMERLMQANNGNDVWSHAVTTSGVPCVVLGHTIISRTDWSKQLGYVYLGIKESFYSSTLYKDINMGEGSEIFILDANGAILSSQNPALPLGQAYKDKHLLEEIVRHEKTGDQVFRVRLNNKDYLGTYTYDIYSNWYLVATIPDTYLTAEMKAIQRNILFVCALCLIFSLLLTFVISTSISVPLNHLIKGMKQVMRGKLEVQLADRNRDEIGYLADRFNKMVEQIGCLLEQTAHEQKMKRETELQMLQAQINPHFLFNTLSSLKWTAQLSQAESVSNGLGALAELLRNTIVDKKEIIPLRQELENIKNYVMIQKIRYGTALTMKYNIDESLLDYRILKFLLQPIVENSIIHGFEGDEYDEYITISCELHDNNLLISVMDNGKGMSESQLQKLLTAKQQSEQRLANIGIANVAERIRLHFGEEYGLNYQSGIGQGTIVTIRLPIIRSDERDHDV